MKIIQIPFCFYPDSVGGTEVYVEALSRELEQQGINTVIAAPAETNQSYLHNQLRVRRFAISSKVNDLKEMYGEGDELGAISFAKILDEEQPDLVHLHAFTRGASLRLVQAAKQRKIPVIFTYHTPTVSCQRGTLLRWGTEICDGKLNLRTCTSCVLQGLGLNQTSVKVIANLPPQVGRLLGNLNLQGGIWTALRMTELVNLRHHALQSMLSEVDHIVAVCNWVKDVLLHNQVPANKITVIRQGLCHSFASKAKSKQKSATPTLKIAFLGRLDPTKGIDILIRALQAVPELPISLDIYGISQGAASNSYQRELQALAALDARISFKPPVPSEQVMTILADYDLLAVPSQCLETGPMVVLEAFAAGIPVLGSNLGGIAELIQHGVNGILVEPASIEAWSQELQRLYYDKDFLTQLRTGIQPPTGMAEVATQMISLYRLYLLPQKNCTAQHLTNLIKNYYEHL